MRTSNSPNHPTVLSRLPEWFGGLLGASGTGRSKKAAEMPLAATIAAVVEQSDHVNVEPMPQRPSREVQSVVDEMLAQGRYALLLRPQLIQNLSPEQLARTRAALADGMCLVPEGQVVLRHTFGEPDADKEHAEGPILRLEAYYLDRYPVTNAQYYAFVASGGYEQMQIWDSEIWAALLDFVDASGHPGPRGWKNGRFARGEDSHPVTGVSWYEAVAYARWIGKRLPSDAEWVKAGSWPVSIPGHPLLLRRYPWGEAMDRGRANLWGSGPGRTVSVHEFPGGVSVGGVHQLIGNVWEWTADAFAFSSTDQPGVSIQTKMKSIRGGAFDTYLDSQATCHFQSADVALSRKRNIGFRCAIHLSDLAARRDEADSDYEDNSAEEDQS
jgi:iron(II)-dependent oxidoreductase